MFLIEHHGKELLAAQGLPVPRGIFVPSGGDARGAPGGALMVKAQVPAGGRGKAGGVRRIASAADIAGAIAACPASLHGRPVHGVRIEECVAFEHEAYLSFSIDARAAQVRLLMTSQGGVDVEHAAGVLSACADPGEIAQRARALAAALPGTVAIALAEAAPRLAEIFLRYEAMLLEINPLFVHADASWTIGDVKLVIDDSAIVRQPAIRALLEQHTDIYPESARKLAHGFDYVEVDPGGDIGLITTGAGLSMQLIDELRVAGRRPVNFCDIRSGQFRGDPARLIAVMRWLAARPHVEVALVNIFAGITDLAEFASLLVTAAKAVPELRVPMVARLIGRNLEAARHILDQSGLAVTLEPDLDRAVALTLAALDRGERPRG